MSNSIRRASAFLGPSGSMAEVTFAEDRLPKLQWLVQVGQNGSARNAVKAVLDLSDGSQLAPPADRHNLAGKGVILLPERLPPDHQDTATLLDAMIGFINRYCDIPPLWEKLIAHYALMSWVFDRFTAVPYLRFLGEPQSGKTRCLMTAAHLCYKPVIGGGSTSTSALFRLQDVWRGTFVIDEADFGKSDLWADIVKMLNNGYMRGPGVIRSEKEGTGYDPNSFAVFGPKILSTREDFADVALESRCITLRTEDRPVAGRIPRQLPEEFYSESRSLQNRLLQWRLDNFASINGSQTELLGLSPRLGQICVPLWTVSPDPGFRLDLIDFLSCASKEQKANSSTGCVAEALHRLCFNTNVWPTTVSLKDLVASVREVAEDWGVESKFGPKNCSGLIRSLGLNCFRNRSGVYEFSLSRAVLDEILVRHRTT